MMSNWLIKYFKGIQGAILLIKTRGLIMGGGAFFCGYIAYVLRLAAGVIRHAVILLSAEGRRTLTSNQVVF